MSESTHNRLGPGGLESSRTRVAFLFIGGSHHLLHTLPVAVALARRGTVEVAALVDTEATAGAIAALIHQLGGAPISIQVLPAPGWLTWLGRVKRKWSMMKAVRLYANARLIGRFDAVVTPERTSTILKRLPGRKPLMIHIPHGAGDRAIGFEPRIRLFDLVIVAGEKDRRRMIAAGVASPDTCVTSGYVKLGAVEELLSSRDSRLFDNDRPIVLYNPHFDRSLSSWYRHGREIIAAFAAQDRYNLIVAPHVRLFQDASPAERAEIEALAVPGRILIDLGSSHCNDMTYTLSADVYLGDVSSQVYEFISRPRPCLFLDANNHAWKDDPNYACWAFGPVITSARNVVDEVDRAIADQPTKEPLQRAAAREAMGEPTRAAGVAADAIMAALTKANADAKPLS
jgi:hypothetical protein